MRRRRSNLPREACAMSRTDARRGGTEGVERFPDRGAGVSRGHSRPSRRSARAGHSPERGETARARTTGNERPKARTIGRVSRPRDSGVTGGRRSSTHWPSGRRVGVKPRMPIMKGPNHPWRSETPKARRPASHTAGRGTRSNRRGTDPYARWCGRGGAARLPPVPISAQNGALAFP